MWRPLSVAKGCGTVTLEDTRRTPQFLVRLLILNSNDKCREHRSTRVVGVSVTRRGNPDFVFVFVKNLDRHALRAREDVSNQRHAFRAREDDSNQRHGRPLY